MMKNQKQRGELRLVSFAAILGIVFILIFSGVQLNEVPFKVGQAIKISIAKGSARQCLETDSGNDVETKGVTSIIKNNEIMESKQDYCSPDDKLVEYYCSNTKIVNKIHSCTCEEGVCVVYSIEQEETFVNIDSDQLNKLNEQKKGYMKKQEPALVFGLVDTTMAGIDLGTCSDTESTFKKSRQKSHKFSRIATGRPSGMG